MMYRPPKLQADYALQVILAMFKFETWQTALLFFLLLLSFNLFTRGVYDLFQGEFQKNEWLIIGPFFLLVGGLVWLARTASARVRPLVHQEDCPQKCKALILFLSLPGEDLEWLSRGLKQEIRGGIMKEEVRKEFKGSWRMPVDAIAYHLERLEKIVAIPSSDSPQKEDGTFRRFNLFKRVVEWIVGETNPTLELLSLSELDPKCSEGVDFENAEALVDAVELAFEWFNEKEIKDYEIMVDVTGGQKVPTVAGAAVALAEGRRFQYVSTRDYSVRSYDITYRVRS